MNNKMTFQKKHLEKSPTRLQVLNIIVNKLDGIDISLEKPFCFLDFKFNQGLFSSYIDFTWEAEFWGVPEAIIDKFIEGCNQDVTFGDYCELLAQNTKILDIDSLQKIDEDKRYFYISDFIQDIFFTRTGKNYPLTTPVENLHLTVFYSIMSIFIRSDILRLKYFITFKPKPYSWKDKIDKLFTIIIVSFLSLFIFLLVLLYSLHYWVLQYFVGMTFMCIVLPFCFLYFFIREIIIDKIYIDSCHTLGDFVQALNKELSTNKNDIKQ
ncbi:MAG: hypothetical protein LBP59_19075 [Planctomycetaceae bacterium]|jgi:hypothetical protein|nr:hypothetical protein [Planctomycetaceae bacterium]